MKIDKENMSVILLMFMLFLFPMASAQTIDEKVESLERELMSLSIETNSTLKFSSIEKFDKIFAGKQVVALGEQNHGDGTTFELYAKLVELLHSRYGFEAIVFESGFYDCHKAWTEIKKGVDPMDAFDHSIFKVWSKSKQAHPLFKYIATNAHKKNALEIAGFDPQFSGYYGKKVFLDDIDSIVNLMNPDLFSSQSYSEFREMAQQITDYSYPPNYPSTKSKATFSDVLIKIINSLQNDEFSHNDFWIQSIKNLEAQANHIWSLQDLSDKLISSREYGNFRDIQMAKNALWLLNGPLKGKKIILWGNSYHFMKDLKSSKILDTSKARLMNGAISMGDHLYEQLGDKLYIIGSITYSGKAGVATIPQKIEILPGQEGSLEHLFHLTDEKAAYLDLHPFNSPNSWLNQPIIARPDGRLQFMTIWPNTVNGILFIDKMEASTFKDDFHK